LLEDLDWEADGYRLFEASTLAPSSGRGWFGALAESSALFLPRASWERLGGLDERFELPGGGFVNHDAFARACGEPDATLVVLLGEGTFHQFHGGASTSGRVDRAEMAADYEAIRGRPYERPTIAPVLVGSVPPSVLGELQRSVALAIERRDRKRLRRRA
jgi:hypothetical protein